MHARFDAVCVSRNAHTAGRLDEPDSRWRCRAVILGHAGTTVTMTSGFGQTNCAPGAPIVSSSSDVTVGSRYTTSAATTVTAQGSASRRTVATTEVFCLATPSRPAVPHRGTVPEALPLAAFPSSRCRSAAPSPQHSVAAPPLVRTGQHGVWPAPQEAPHENPGCRLCSKNRILVGPSLALLCRLVCRPDAGPMEEAKQRARIRFRLPLCCLFVFPNLGKDVNLG